MPVFLLSFVEGFLGPKFSKFAKPLIFAVLGLLILSAMWGGKCAYDAHVISTHDAKQDAATAKADRAADNHAAEQRRTDDAHTTQEAQQIKEAVNEAGNDPATRRAAYYRCVAKQQTARQKKVGVPNC